MIKNKTKTNMLVLNFSASVKRSATMKDGQLKKITREVETNRATTQTQAQLLFAERKNSLETEMVKASKDKGGLELPKVYAYRERYIRREAELDNNYSDYNMTGLAMVFDVVVGKALSTQARTMDSETAGTWDDEIHDLNHEHGVFISASNLVGNSWTPCSLSELAPFTTGYADEGTKEPYAGTTASDFF